MMEMHGGSMRINSSSLWRSGDDVFSRSNSTRREQEDDEEALKWAALERLPTYDRVRKGILMLSEGEQRQIDVENLSGQERKILLERLIRVTDEDNERFLLKLRQRINRVGLELPTIEVRFENINIDAQVHVGNRGLPTLCNWTINALEEFAHFLRILPSKKRPFTILHDVSGIIKPGRLTLLLGPPGSGKTTLLLALAGKLTSDLKVSGQVTYNGHDMNEFVPRRTAAYIGQYDLHIGEMTVRETLAFSARCQGVGTRYDMLTELCRREKEANVKPDPDVDIFMKATSMEGQESHVITDYILKILGLEICADTMVGDQMLRGISGGQKKRVTTGEMIVGPARALFMDEISNGLDSSTTFQIVNSLRQMVHILSATGLISLLQPAPETFELFDDIILLSDGQIVYQGPRGHVLEFFEHMGFRCPARKGVADFLQEVTSRKDQQQYWMRSAESYRYVAVKEFANAFEKFYVGQRLKKELSVPFDKRKSHPAALSKSKYGISKKELLKACTAREILLMKRNSFVYIFRTVQLLVIAFIIMTLFLRTNMHHRTVNDGVVFMGALFFLITTEMFNGFSELAMTIAKLPIFFKQRDYLFYPAWTYALPTWLLKIPITLIETAVLVLSCYYVVGFDPNVWRLAKQYFVLLFVNQMASGLFRFVGVLGRDLVVSNTIGAFILLLLLVLGGFILSHDDVKKWWTWGYWISPLMYAQNAITVNEFLADSWRHIVPGSNKPLGVLILKSRGIFTDANWYWIGLSALVGYVLLFNSLFTLALAYLKPPGKSQPTLTEETLMEKHANRTGKPLELLPAEKTLIDSPSATNGDPPGSSSSTGSIWSMFIPKYDGQSDSHRRSSKFRSISAYIEPKWNRKGMVLPFTPLALTFKNIKYSVDMPPEMKAQGIEEDRLTLLNGVSGCFRPGVLTALMGVSGAGKTTLMDVLAGRKTGGYIDGKITISGYPKKQETFARISGYCEQNDIHSPNVTVYESLVFSAWLRLQPDVSPETKKLFIEEVMELVELTPLRGALVGIPGVNGLSTEQRKRLTIAVELVANPSIIFMDEPTSGLDARAAAIVMRTVRNTVDTGRTVVCTIHQPSIDIFESFDELFLIKRGGEEIYVGPLGHHCCHLIDYFEGIKGVNKIKDGYNPATWMLEVTSSAQEEVLGINFNEIYKQSELYKRNKALIKEMSTPPPGSSDIHFRTQYSQTFVTQCIACLWKQYYSYWRNPPYSAVRFYFTVVISMLYGSMFWQLGGKRENQQDIFNAIGSMYSAVMFLGISYCSSVQPVVAIERTVFYRERAAGMYSALPYALGQILIEIPYVFIQALIYGVIVYAMIGFEWNPAKFFWYLFYMYFTLLYFTYYGMLAVGLTPNSDIAAIISAALYGVWNVFSGFIIPRPRMAIWWRWYYWICPVSWTMYGLATSQFGDVHHKLDTKETVSEFLRTFFGFKHELLGLVAVVIVLFTVAFAVLFGVAIKMLNFQKR